MRVAVKWPERTATGEMLVVNGDVTLRVVVAGEGPVVLFVPGWPELASSWRLQMVHFAQRGYRVAALDVRGYGGSSAPLAVERYTLRELAADVAAVAAALDDDPIVLVGHDWGAPIAWTTAIRYPDRVRAVAGLSVPHTPPTPLSLIDLFDQLYAGRFFYMLYFQEPYVAEMAFEADLRAALKRVYFGFSGLAPVNSLLSSGSRDDTLLSLLPEPPDGPLAFISDAELDEIVATFERTGLTGAFNRYRALTLDVETSSDILGAMVHQPSCFIAGELDPVRALIPGNDLFANAGASCTDFRGTTLINGAGHWVQQEAPAAVNDALEYFLESL